MKPQSELLSGEGLPGGMDQVEATVLAHRTAAPDHYLMRLKAPLCARRAKPGQFIHILCRPEGDTHPLLRRPFSLLDADPARGTIEFIYKVVGTGTSVLTRMPVGSPVDLLGPLGQPFEIPPRLKTACLVGGGVGIPPLYMLAKRVGAARTKVFLGARTKGWVICADLFRKLGAQVHIATDDGSLGYQGSVVDLLERHLSPAAMGPSSSPVLYVCGPTPMMAAAARLAESKGIPAQVSLEERMGCAMGVCMGCVVEVATKTHSVHARFQRVCTEGPVFPSEAIVWTSPSG
ncbi:MAG: dihydroorotate dehydrogenase electron transfer subunit [Candidatus Omnitrophica bacterium]|nr:dihydroorotate dehydrogenase electron transfer subunit [Candidatus Omnitrophota bacterium]